LRHVVVRPGAARDIHSFPTRRSSDLVVIGELPRLFRNCLGDFGPSVADVHAVKARKGIEAAPSVGVDDGTALAPGDDATGRLARSEEHTSELQSRENHVCRLLLAKKN